MFGALARRLFGSANDRYVKSLGPLVEQINDHEAELQQLSDEALRGWAGKHGRNLNEAEQYGVAKIRLFDAFDEIEDMMSGGRRLSLSGDLLEDATKRLSLE